MKKIVGYKDIYSRYKKSILSGELVPGEKVPSIRALATELNLAKKTVELAYEILKDEGYLKSYGPAGTKVNPDFKILNRHKKELTEITEEPNVIDLLDPKGHFRLGIPAFDVFPIKAWQKMSNKVIKTLDQSSLDYPDPTGSIELKSQLAKYLNLSRGINCVKEQIFITNGYQSSMTLILDSIFKPNDKMIMEEPGFFIGREFLKKKIPKIHYCPVDSDGINTKYLNQKFKKAKICLTTPNHHSPLCYSLSLPRRNQLLDWATKTDAWILEDDYDGEFHYKKKQLPALKNLDKNDRVIYMGTFSKTIMPSLRVSYLVIPQKLINLVKESSKSINQVPSIISQKLISQFLKDRLFYKHLKRMRSIYANRRQFVVESINEIFPNQFEFDLPDGGMHIIAYVKDQKTEKELSKKWQENGLLVTPLSLWFQGKQDRFGLVIGFTNIKSRSEVLNLLQKVN